MSSAARCLRPASKQHPSLLDIPPPSPSLPRPLSLSTFPLLLLSSCSMLYAPPDPTQRGPTRLLSSAPHTCILTPAMTIISLLCIPTEFSRYTIERLRTCCGDTNDLSTDMLRPSSTQGAVGGEEDTVQSTMAERGLFFRKGLAYLARGGLADWVLMPRCS